MKYEIGDRVAARGKTAFEDIVYSDGMIVDIRGGGSFIYGVQETGNLMGKITYFDEDELTDFDEDTNKIKKILEPLVRNVFTQDWDSLSEMYAKEILEALKK